MKKDIKNESENEIAKFTKEQILKSKRFSDYNKDVLNTVIKNDNTYSIDEVQKLVKLFLEKEV